MALPPPLAPVVGLALEAINVNASYSRSCTFKEEASNKVRVALAVRLREPAGPFA